MRSNGEEIVPTRWAEKIEGEFAAELRLEVETRKGVIAELAATITAADANIEQIGTVERKRPPVHGHDRASGARPHPSRKYHAAPAAATPVISLSRNRNS